MSIFTIFSRLVMFFYALFNIFHQKIMFRTWLENNFFILMTANQQYNFHRNHPAAVVVVVTIIVAPMVVVIIVVVQTQGRQKRKYKCAMVCVHTICIGQVYVAIFEPSCKYKWLEMALGCSVETFITQKNTLMVNVAPLLVCTRLFKKIRKEKNARS